MDAFYEAKKVVVNNHFRKSNPMSWAHAFSGCTIESIVAFNPKKKIILYNNRFGTLDGAGCDDLVDLYALFEYYGRFYINAADCLSLVERVFTTVCPTVFIMQHRSGWQCNCRAYPVISEGQLGGVVFMAHRENGTELQIGEDHREQSAIRN